MQLGSKYVDLPEKYCPQAPGWSFSKTGGLHVLKCKSRKCEYCGQFWAWKWRQALAEKDEYDQAMGIPRARLALTLTLRQNVEYLTVQRVLEFFWRSVRKKNPDLEYWGVVECDQKHQRPHFHFILANCVFIPYQDLRQYWVNAQKWAGINDQAWVLRVETIEKNIQAYFTKYVTKLLGGKDEIPRRDQWQGRYIRYSRKFFPASVSTMAVYASWRRQWEANRFDWPAHPYSQYQQHITHAGLTHFINECKITDQEIIDTLNREWDYLDDHLRVQPLDPLDIQPNLELDYSAVSTLPKQGTMRQAVRAAIQRQNNLTK